MKMNAVRQGVDVASVSRAIQPPQQRMIDKARLGDLREVAIAAGQLDAANAKFPLFAVGEWRQRFGIDHGIADPGKGASYRDGLVGSQQLSTGVGTDLGGTICINNLPSGPRPGLHQ